MGSWAFIIIQTIILVVWVIVNTDAIIHLVKAVPLSHGSMLGTAALMLKMHFDPYPFIFMNLFMSTEAAYATPLILMAQNRSALRDKIQAEHEYKHQEQELRFNTKMTTDIHKFLATGSEDNTADTPGIDQVADNKIEEILHLLRAMEARDSARSATK